MMIANQYIHSYISKSDNSVLLLVFLEHLETLIKPKTFIEILKRNKNVYSHSKAKRTLRGSVTTIP